MIIDKRYQISKIFTSTLLGISLLVTGDFAFAAQGFNPNDPLNSELWYLDALQIRQAWGYSQGDGVIVAIIDSGVDVDHPDLVGQIWINQKETVGDGKDNDGNGYIDDYQGWDFIDSDNDPKPTSNGNCITSPTCNLNAYYHGTVVAGIIAAKADNGFAISGLAPKARIMALRVLNVDGSGSSSDVVRAVAYAINNGANVINMSFVGNINDPAMKNAIELAYKANVIVVGAAGNIENGKTPINLNTQKRYPVCNVAANGEDIILGVGASDRDFNLADFSNYGSDCVDLLAPGEDILSLINNEPSEGLSFYYQSGFAGTSLAAPMVTATVALMKSYRPNLKSPEIFKLIKENALNIDAKIGSTTKVAEGVVQPLPIIIALTQTPSTGPIVSSGVRPGDLFKSKSVSTVYYYGNNGRRYVFPDSSTYFSWYPDFNNIKTVSDSEVANITLGGVVTYRPGSALVKIASSSQVYVVDRGGLLRWVTTDTIARELYGNEWWKKVKGISDAFFPIYKIGTQLEFSAEYNLSQVLNSNVTIDQDKGI